MNTLAWNNGIGLRDSSSSGGGSSCPILLVFGTAVMVKRDSWGHSYSVVRGEILGFTEDEQLRKHLPRMFSLIKNESWGFEDDQIPS